MNPNEINPNRVRKRKDLKGLRRVERKLTLIVMKKMQPFPKIFGQFDQEKAVGWRLLNEAPPNRAMLFGSFT